MDAQLTLLCVDDDEPNVSSLREILQHEDFTVLCAASIEAALQALEGTSIDICLVNHKLFTKSETAVADRMKAIRPKLRVLVYSADPEVAYSLPAGVDGHVPIPEAAIKMLTKLRESH